MTKMNFKDIDKLKNEFRDVLADKDSTQDEQFEAMEQYYRAIAEKATEQVKAEYAELNDVTDNQVLQARGIYTLTSEEQRFYNQVKKTGQFPADELLPETVIERVFDDLQKDRPLLREIKFVPGAGRQKIITSKRLGKAVWGPLHRNLEGQLDATFDTRETSLKNLTAFFLISNDTLDLGARWIDRYIRICLSEAIAEAWEEAIILGDGNNQPIGLMKDLNGSVVQGKYPDKASSGTLTLAEDKIVEEFGGILKDLSKYTVKYKDAQGEEQTEERTRKVNGSIKLVINPADYYEIATVVTSRNTNGVYVTNLPFIPMTDVIESEFVPQGKIIAFLKGGYDAQASYSNRINKYKETFAMDRATLFAIDTYGDGAPSDNDVARVYDLKLANAPVL